MSDLGIGSRVDNEGMSTTDTANTLNSVRYTRKANLGDYHQAEASITIAFDGDVVADQAGFEANARKAFFEAKGLVLSELGATFTADSEGLIQEAFERAIPGVTQATNSTGAVQVEGGTLLGEYEGYAVKLSHSKFGPFIVWGDVDSPQAIDGKAFTANVATWDTVVVDGDKKLDPSAGEYTLAKAVKQIVYKQKNPSKK